MLDRSGSVDKTLIGATCVKQRTLEDAIWKESSSEFLIVDDNILNMPDCTLSIKCLSEREIEIQLDPKPKPTQTAVPSDMLEIEEEVTQDDFTKREQSPEKENEVQKDVKVAKTPNQSDIDTTSSETMKPKIKIGTEKPKKRTRIKAKSSSKSDTPRYSMQIRPTPRRLSIGGRTLRTQ